MTIASQPPPPALKATWNRGRIVGYGLMALWILAGLGLVAYIISSIDPDFYAKYAPKFAKGLWVTIQLVVISIILGALISLPVAFGRMSSNRIIGGIAFGYVYFFRGTPLLAQVFLLYYGAGTFQPQLEAIGLWQFLREAYFCAILAFSLNTSAYQAEILRGAIQNMPKGQWEAGQALGLPRPVIFWKIILPQALIVALRPYGNEIVLMIKGSAIASIVTVLDLMGETRRAFSRSFDFQTYIWAAIMYLVMVEGLRRLWERIENRLTRHLKRISE